MGVGSGANGTLLWSTVLPGLGPVTQDQAPTIGSDGTVYCASLGYVTALDGRTGTVKWQVGHDFTSASFLWSPTLSVDGTAYFAYGLASGANSQPGYIAALDSTTGATKWKISAPTATSYPGSPAIGLDGTLYVNWIDYKTYDTWTCAMDGILGEIKWQIKTPGTHVTIDGGLHPSMPTLSNGIVFYVNPYPAGAANPPSQLFAASESTGSLLWQRTLKDNGQYIPRIGLNGKLYIHYYLYFDALQPSSGAVIWSDYHPFSGWNLSTGLAITADGFLMEGSTSGGVGMANTSNGGSVWKRNDLEQYLDLVTVASDGTSYYTGPNNLYAIDGSGNDAWTYKAVNMIFQSPTAIGSDGTLYTVGQRAYSQHLVVAIASANSPSARRRP